MHRIAGPLTVALLAAPIVPAQTTERASIATNGWQANAAFDAAMSADGRFVAFVSDGPNLVPGDTNGKLDVFVRDRRYRTTERVSVSSSGAQADDDCFLSSISANGRFVCFTSEATSLVPRDTNGKIDIFVRDRRSGTTEIVSVSSAGAQANSHSSGGSLSADGRFVAFESWANNLVPGDLFNGWDVFVRDRLRGTTERVSVSSAGVEGDSSSVDAAISADGRYVAFRSWASNLVANDANGSVPDIFVRDRLLGTTELASLSTTGTQGTGECRLAAISADGRFVAFDTPAPGLVPGDMNRTADVFVRDRLLGTLERVSVSTAGIEANDGSGRSFAISGDGRYVAFDSLASNLVDGDTNGAQDVFVRDRLEGTTKRVSVAMDGAQGNSWSGSDDFDWSDFTVAISADGRFVAFESRASNLVAGDTNAREDVFVRDRDTTLLALLCEPGYAGAKSCPCANPPAGPGRGCDNSSASGGATIDVSGSAKLSADDVVFTASWEPPRALGVLLQGDALLAAGVWYGQGVRCAGGSEKRLFTKVATGQRITVPDFAVGDPSISARSAAQGDPIPAGATRWYLVYYRDPIVPGGCAPASTFNATPTRQATWGP